MGEWSKSIGEKGEEISKFVFEDILNFNSLSENLSIACVNGEKHKLKSSKNNRTTHGIDGLISYKSPLEDRTIDVGVISTKYVGKEYPTNVSSKFKEHLTDLAFTLECYRNSKLRNNINQKFSNVNKTEMFGILVWLSNTSDIKFDLISQVKNIQLKNDLVFDKIILVDNNRVSFLFDSVYLTKQSFGVENVDFIYHKSGLNHISIGEFSYGKIFPLNYLYSDVLALRIINDSKTILSIFVNDDFEENQFIQILDFAKSFDHLDTVDNLIINYRTYDHLTNEVSVKERLTGYSNYRLKENLVIQKFPKDYRN